MSLKNALIMQNDNGTTTTAIQIDTAITSNNVPVVINAAGNVGVATDTPLATLDVGGTGAIKVPVGTEAQRPSPEATGQFRFNSDTGQFEGYNGTLWGSIGGGATGGEVNAVTSVNGNTGAVTVQPTLISGTNIKTVNGTSLLGSGDILIEGSGGGGGGMTETTLTKSFVQGESATIFLNDPISIAPVVSVIKEIPQVGVLSKENWDVASSGANYDRHNTAFPGADLEISIVTTRDLAQTTFDNVTLLNPNSTQDADIAFNNTGTKLYAMSNQFILRQFSLSTSFDISTASDDLVEFSFNNTFSHATDSFCWNNTGTRIYAYDGFNGGINQYDLSTAFDISTIDFNSVSIANVTLGSGASVQLNDTGTQLYVLNPGTYEIQVYSSFSAPFDITGATLEATTFTFSHPTNANYIPIAFTFIEDGVKLLISYSNYAFESPANTEIIELTLSVAFDLSTASFTGKLFVADNLPNSAMALLRKSLDDTKLYLGNDVQQNTVQLFQYSFGEETVQQFGLSTGSFTTSDVGKQLEGNGGVAVLLDATGIFELITPFDNTNTIPAGEWGAFALKFNPQKGIKLAGIIQSAGIDNAVYDTVLFSDSNNINNLGRFRFNATGTRLFVGDIGFGQIAQYDLSTPFDISTASFSTAPQTTITPVSFAFSSDGLVITVMSSNQLQVFSLPTAFDLSGFDFFNATTTFQTNLSFGAADVSYNSTGTRLFITRNNVIQQYDLTAAFDVNDLSTPFELSFDQNDTAVSTVFVDGGRRLFVAGNRADPNTGQQPSIVFEISLAVPFDLTTASFSPNTFAPTEFSTANAIQFNNDLTKMFLTGDSQAIYQYSAGILAFVQPLDQYSPAVTNVGGQIDTTTWLDINAMAADQESNDGEVFYAVSTDNKTSWKVIDDVLGERTIARDNSGVWQFNSNATYELETFTNSAVNDELYTLQQALAQVAANRMDKSQLELVSDANHYVLGNSLDLMIALYLSNNSIDVPTSDGVAIDYDAETLNQGAVHGIDYDYDFPNSTTVRVVSKVARNLKIRII